MPYGFNEDKSKFDIGANSHLFDFIDIENTDIATRAYVPFQLIYVKSSDTLYLTKAGSDGAIDPGESISAASFEETSVVSALNTILAMFAGGLAIRHGGTGMNTSPSMLVNLGSGSAASVFQANPRPGVTGKLPVTYGGSGQGGVSDTSTTTDIVKSAGTNCQVVAARALRWGEITQLTLGIKCNAAKSAGDTLATLLSDRCPIMRTPLMNAATPSQSCIVTAAGLVQAQGSISSGATIYVTGTYLLP